MCLTKNWISSSIGSLGLSITDLSQEESWEIYRDLSSKFADSVLVPPLWEKVRSFVSKKRTLGWQEIGEFVNESPCLLLIEDDDVWAFRISNGRELNMLLADCPGFEFYVTNEDLDFLLCHNHHDYLIGAGTSQTWVSTKCDDIEPFGDSD